VSRFSNKIRHEDIGMETGSGIRKLFPLYFSAPVAGSRPRTRANRQPAFGSLRLFALLVAAFLGAGGATTQTAAAPALVIDARTGAVIYASEATLPWYPASLTKLITAYVALEAVQARRIALDTPLAVSPRATAAPPSKMGFRPGTLVTLDNALKMLMVKSANDIAVTIAEGVSGSVEAFAEDMNAAAARLGMSQSHFVNPNGLPDPRHVSSARDMALVAQALYGAFPQYGALFSIGALRFGDDVIKNHNNMLGRYPGADGMKTGFTCPAGFNLVASATRDGRKLIAVVLGAPNVELRTLRTALLFDRAFAGIDRMSIPVSALPITGMNAPPDMRNAICRKPAATIAAFNAENERLAAPLYGANGSDAGQAYAATSLTSGAPMASRMALVPQLAFDPVPVYIGAPEGYGGLIARARPAHSPIGTAGAPETMQAYTEQPANLLLEAQRSPLVPDHKALPMKGLKKPVRAAAGRKSPAQPRVVANSEMGSGQPKLVPKPPARPARK
jgi:D-alanyl-D-alanine carboxypeptidase